MIELIFDTRYLANITGLYFITIFWVHYYFTFLSDDKYFSYKHYISINIWTEHLSITKLYST
jgi:hypothetical protein